MAALASIAATLACTGRPPRVAAGPAGVPRVGWVIMRGDRDTPDREFVCQSLPRNACVVPASRGDARTFAHVHVYYLSAAAETRYTGSVRVGFLQGGSAHEFRPDLTVKPADGAGNQSVVGIVTDKPGTYQLAVAVAATAIATGATQQIRDDVAVTVQ